MNDAEQVARLFDPWAFEQLAKFAPDDKAREGWENQVKIALERAARVVPLIAQARSKALGQALVACKEVGRRNFGPGYHAPIENCCTAIRALAYPPFTRVSS